MGAISQSTCLQAPHGVAVADAFGHEMYTSERNFRYNIYHESIGLSILKKLAPNPNLSLQEPALKGWTWPECNQAARRGACLVRVNEPVSPGIEEWNYQQLTAEEVGNHLAQYTIDS